MRVGQLARRGPVELDEPVQRAGVALLGDGHEQRDDAGDDEARQAHERADGRHQVTSAPPHGAPSTRRSTAPTSSPDGRGGAATGAQRAAAISPASSVSARVPGHASKHEIVTRRP